MASLSTTVRFQPLSMHKISQGNGRSQSIATLRRAKSNFPTLRTSRLRISCAAKPETIDKVCSVVKEQLALAPDIQVTAESTFEKLGADSLDTVEIVMALEEAYGINVEEDSAQSITTIQDAADVIEKLLEKKA